MLDCGLPKGKRATTLSIIQCFEKRVEPDARYNRGTIVKVNSPVIVRMAERFTSLLQGKGTRGFYPGILSIFSRSGFMCMTFYRRDGHVVEVQTGSAVSRPEEACSTPHFQQHNIPFLTLVSKYNRIVRIIPLFCWFVSSFCLRHVRPFLLATRECRRCLWAIYYVYNQSDFHDFWLLIFCKNDKFCYW